MPGIRLFYFVLFGQAFVLLGSTLVNFGLGVWAYETAGQVKDYVFIAVAASLPGILFGPIVGAMLDRWSRKSILLIAQLVCALASLALAVLYWFGLLQLWQILVIVPISSVAGTALQVGFTSTISLVVPRESLSRANGALGLTFGTIQLAGPLLAGLTMDSIGINGIFVFNLTCFCIGLLTLLVANIPSPEQAEKKTSQHNLSGAWQDLKDAYRYLQSKPGVLGGLLLFTLILFNVSVVQVLFLPLILSIGSRTDLGFVQSMGGVGMLVGGILMVAWKGIYRKMLLILAVAVVISILLFLIPLTSSIPMLAFGAFAVMFLAPIANTSSQTLWQLKIDPAYQGRVFSLRNSVLRANQPIAFIAAGFLADHIFEPHMIEGQILANYLGHWWGVGEGRGIAVLISCTGVIGLLLVAIAATIKSIRRVDLDIPDFEPVDKNQQP